MTYAGEGGQDAGGLFRDCVSHICADLQSPHVPLFIKCPNASGFGNNQEKYVPNPSATSSLHLSMYAFVGKLMVRPPRSQHIVLLSCVGVAQGMAIRGKHMLNLDLPAMVWKPLVGHPVTREDLKAIDSLCVDVLEKLSNIDENCTEDNFRDLFPYQFDTVHTHCSGC